MHSQCFVNSTFSTLFSPERERTHDDVSEDVIRAIVADAHTCGEKACKAQVTAQAAWTGERVKNEQATAVLYKPICLSVTLE